MFGHLIRVWILVILQGKNIIKSFGNILGGTLVTKQTGPAGKKVNKILIAQDVYYPGESEPKEFYVGILLDRNKGCNVIMASAEGGVDIEEVAEKTPAKIIK